MAILVMSDGKVIEGPSMEEAYEMPMDDLVAALAAQMGISWPPSKDALHGTEASA